MKTDENLYWRSKWLNSKIPPQPVPESLQSYIKPKEPAQSKGRWSKIRKWAKNALKWKIWKH